MWAEQDDVNNKAERLEHEKSALDRGKIHVVLKFLQMTNIFDYIYSVCKTFNSLVWGDREVKGGYCLMYMVWNVCLCVDIYSLFDFVKAAAK